jgi:hypothetical protein
MVGLKAQEVLVPLHYNPLVGKEENLTKNSGKNDTPLLLPFRDDFSYKGPNPDQTKWSDHNVLINTSYAVHSKTWGVATFDALDSSGKLYQGAEDSPNQFEADFLTSRAIDLSGLIPADSVLLTFYYQPQGKGGDPRQRDSLVVEFYRGINDLGQEDWQSVWRASGQTLLDFAGNQHPYFHRATIFVEDPIFFTNGFKFRIRNYASLPTGSKTPPNLAGNYGIWNVDYILLDKNRSVGNASYHDIAFAAGAKAFIEPYSYMPWMHFIENPGQYLKANLENKITNLGDQEFNYSYLHFLTDEQGSNLGFYDGGTWNILPFDEFGYETYPTFASPVFHLGGVLPLTPAPRREFTLTRAIREGTAGDGFKRNDTIKFKQVFDNFYAYDYGVSTFNYLLVGNQGKRPKGALKFELAKEDQLKAVQIFINRSYKEADNNIPLRITIWKNLQPLEVIYQSPIITPQFSDYLNGFITYFLEAPEMVSGTIYVGWEQEGPGLMNLGWDSNVVNTSDIVFYNDGDGWFPSNFSGSLMIRPIVGELGSVAIPHEPVDNIALKIFPNPLVGSLLNIETAGIQNINDYSLEIFDISGRHIHSQRLSPRVDLSGLASGAYIVRILNNTTNHTRVARLVVAR